MGYENNLLTDTTFRVKPTFVVSDTISTVPLLEANNPPRYPISPVDFRYEGNENVLVENVVKALDDNTPISPDVAKAALCRVVEEYNLGYHFVLHDAQKTEIPFSIPWPRSTWREYPEYQVVVDNEINKKKEGESTFWLRKIYQPQALKNQYPAPGKYSGYLIEPEHSTIFPKGVRSDEPNGDYSPLHTVVSEAILQMKPHEQDEVIGWVFEHLIDSVINTADLREDILPTIFSIIRNSPNKSRLMWHPLQYVHTHSQAYHYQMLLKESERHLEHDDPVDEVSWRISQEEYGVAESVKYVAQLGDTEAQKKFLGILIDNTSFVDTLNTVRKLIEDPKYSGLKPQLEGFGKMLLGFDPNNTKQNFHTSLGSFYNAVDLNKMEHLIAATEDDIEVLTMVINQYNLTDKLKVFLGCGKGRHTNPLAKMGFARGMIGVDIVPEEVHEAQKTDETRSVVYREGDWNNLDFLDDESVDFVSNIGRNWTHAEKRKNFHRALTETARIMKKGAVAVVDMPHYDKGYYRKFRERLLGILESFGLPLDTFSSREEALSHLEATVDNPFPNDPGSSNWTNRYVPSESTLEEEFGSVKLRIVGKISRDIKGWGGAQNEYWIVMKE